MHPESVSVPDVRHEPVIRSIQVLRAVAALMVLTFHAAYMVNRQGGYVFAHSNSGAAGVDVFFIISGFIVAYITRSGTGSPVAFLKRRLIRIAPSYWLYTTMMLVVLAAFPGAFAHLKFDLNHVLMSYVFLLSNNNEDVVGTLLGVGWTICFEMYFYALAAAFMMVPRQYRTIGLSIVVVSGAVLEHVVAVAPFASVALSALPLEFLAGYLLAKLYLRGISLPGVAAAGAIALGSAALYLAGRAELVASERDLWRVVYFGGPAFCLVSGVISLDARGSVSFPEIATAIGGASYSLYLSHQFVLYAIGRIWTSLGLQDILPVMVLLVVAIVLPVLSSLVAFLWFERPLTRWLNRRWSSRGPISGLADDGPRSPFDRTA